ncbi:MAG: Rne/Rng family ribonuclease, partial [Methyloligellaceae bacterium]
LQDEDQDTFQEKKGRNRRGRRAKKNDNRNSSSASSENDVPENEVPENEASDSEPQTIALANKDSDDLHISDVVAVADDVPETEVSGNDESVADPIDGIAVDADAAGESESEVSETVPQEQDADTGSDAADEDDEDNAKSSPWLNENNSDDASSDMAAQSLDKQDSAETDDEEGEVESVGSEDVLEEVPERVRRRRRTYKIQEVIKRRQIILVQVVKEERGNKGAALTTYLSLAGRYTVLMPNTARGGGISRKIANPGDRKRIRKIVSDLEVPQGMGLIVRTAGASRTKAEIKRDYDYLLRLWENVRDLTLKSTAPALVYAEGDLIKRSIRDLYSKEIDEVLVAGEPAYKLAKDFMRMLMPSHAKNVKPYREPNPLFVQHRIEHQLNAMFSPIVSLKSGGYIVINQTEALVAVDVNSGKATREHSIEDTALKTNVEAAEEVARQLRLRDLAGLIVIDFIDMEERRNIRSVERKLKDCLKNDRARIQVGRISHFGLLEMSRQRLRTGMLEGSTSQCVYCQGTGMIRSTESISLSVLRSIEDTLQSDGSKDLLVTTPVEAAIYILNQKRIYLKDIESRYNVSITILASDALQGTNFSIQQGDIADSGSADASGAVKMDWSFQSPEVTSGEIGEDTEKGKPRRRKRRRKPRSEKAADAVQEEPTGETDNQEGKSGESPEQVNLADEKQSQDAKKSPRRRGRRGGRRRSSKQAEEGLTTEEQTQKQAMENGVLPSGTTDNKGESSQDAAPQDSNLADEAATAEKSEKKPRTRRPRRSSTARQKATNGDASQAEPDIRSGGQEEASPPPLPKDQAADTGHSPAKGSWSGESATETEKALTVESSKEIPESSEPSRRGWWQRRLS